MYSLKRSTYVPLYGSIGCARYAPAITRFRGMVWYGMVWHIYFVAETFLELSGFLSSEIVGTIILVLQKRFFFTVFSHGSFYHRGIICTVVTP